MSFVGLKLCAACALAWIPLLVETVELLCLLEAHNRIGVFQGIKEGTLPAAAQQHLRVIGPVLDGGNRDASGNHGLSKSVFLDRHPHPVVALRQGLKGACARVDAIVTCEGHGGEAKLLPVVKDQPAQGALGGGGGVCGAKHLAAEVLPAEGGGIPLDSEVVDPGRWLCELAPHGHVEAVNDVHVFIELAAVEAAAELDEVRLLVNDRPLGVKLLAIDPELLAGLGGVVDLPGLHGVIPLHARHALELALGLVIDSEVRRLYLDGLGGDGTVVGVNQQVFIDGLVVQHALAGHLDAGIGKLVLHELRHLVVDSVGLDEYKGRVGALGERHLQGCQLHFQVHAWGGHQLQARLGLTIGHGGCDSCSRGCGHERGSPCHPAPASALAGLRSGGRQGRHRAPRCLRPRRPDRQRGRELKQMTH
mmetsp:Transcript_38403/g.108526  ORF Transcript_38403/g.108526 Transcript_38403/m.108526 type:complete len:420 (+) Transcript_38403:293-1552(+)